MLLSIIVAKIFFRFLKTSLVLICVINSHGCFSSHSIVNFKLIVNSTFVLQVVFSSLSDVLNTGIFIDVRLKKIIVF